MAEAVRHIDLPIARVATGPVRLGTDWPGVFIRGDEALALAELIEAAQLDGTTLPCGGNGGALLNRMVDLLKSCRVTDRGR